jgi:hypothetical protein
MYSPDQRSTVHHGIPIATYHCYDDINVTDINVTGISWKSG